jgi:vacuolar protein sorting-associated protein 16
MHLTCEQGAEDYSVLECRFWSHGFVALLGNNSLVSVTNYSEPRPRLLAPLPNGEVSSWTLIPPSDSSPAGAVEVLVALGKTIYVVDEADAEDRQLDAGPFKHVAVSPNGRSVSLYTEDGKVWIVSSDFQSRLGDYDSKVKTVPKDLMWVGNDAVALAWEDEVHLIGPNGEAAKYFYDGWICLMPDFDGIRLFTNDVCEFLQKVPGKSRS